MFDILIGTIIPYKHALTMIPQLNEKGFESYELDVSFDDDLSDFQDRAKKITEAAEGRKISALGCYGNTVTEPKILKTLKFLIENSRFLDCNIVSCFAGADPDKSVLENIPIFKSLFEPLACLAENNGVKIAFENCGDGWKGGNYNIAYCPDAWELMFNAVTSDSLCLEWEPAHQLSALADPICQLRKWAKKIIHIHGKDATVAWDIIREHGIRAGVQYEWHRLPGFGDSNWSDIVTILLQNGYTGSIDIEGYHDTVHFDDMEWTAQLTSLEYLKKCRGGIDFFEGPIEYRGYQGARHK